MIHRNTNLIFYHNLWTKQNSWIPENYKMYGDHLISDEEVQLQLETMDTFTIGKIINWRY